MLNALLSSALVLVSLGLLLYLLRLLFNALSLPLDGFIERRRFASVVKRAHRCDRQLRSGDLDAALRGLRSAFYLHIIRNRALASSVANHHTALLSRLIAITSDLHEGPVRLFSLAKADRLLNERSELQRRLFAARQSRSGERRGIEAKLHENRRELQATLSSLVDEVRSTHERPRVH
jgi:hypothetical protein